MKKEITVHIEIPKGSQIKYEYDRSQGRIVVDRILRDGFEYPANYGYVKEALDWDGDEMDVIVYSEESFAPGVSLQGRIIGAMKMIDDGETDTKLIAIHDNDYRLKDMLTIEDIPTKWLKTVENFFSTYKNWKRPGITSVNGFENHNYAIAEYETCVELMSSYGHLSKKEFIRDMKIKHPEKYEIK